MCIEIESQKLQTLQHVKYLKKIYKNIKSKNYNFWQTFDLLDKLDLMSASFYIANQLKEYVKLNINIKDLFTEEEWKLLPIKYKIMYNKKINKLFPEIKSWDWLPLIGLIYNFGNLLSIAEFGNLPKWTINNNIFPVGCLYYDINEHYMKNLDYKNKEFNTKYGIYKSFCGFNKIHMSYSSCEFIASQLENLKTKLPKEAIYILRFHKFKSWINGSNTKSRNYTYLANEYDWKMLPLLKLFNKCKNISMNKKIDINEIQKKYKRLANKYINSKYIF